MTEPAHPTSIESIPMYRRPAGAAISAAFRRVAIWLLVGLLLAPIAWLVLAIVRIPAEYIDHIARVHLGRYILNTSLSMVATCLVVGVVGTATAWWVGHYDFPLRRILEWALVLPLAVPAYICAHAYVGFFDFTGPLQRLFRLGLGRAPGSYPVIDFSGIGALIFVLATTLYPYVYVIMRSAFRQQSPRIFESAQSLQSQRSLLTGIALPLARPALVGAIGLVMMETLNEYGAAFYLGVDTITTGIIQTWSHLYDIGSAARLAMMLLVFITVVLIVERNVRGRAHFDNATSHRVSYQPVGRTRGIILTCGCIIPIVLGFVVPALMVGSWVIHSIDPNWPALLVAAGNSLLLVVLVVVLCSMTAMFLAYMPHMNNKGRLDEHIIRFGMLGYSVPGSVVALGVLLLVGYGSPLPTRLLLTNTPIALIYACMMRYVAVSYYPIQAGFTQVCSRFDEASRMLGAGPGRTLWRVNLPLIYRTIGAAALLVAIDVLKELPLSIMLHPFNYDTLALQAFRLANDERLIDAAPASLLIMIGGVVLLATIYIPIMRQRRRQ